MSVSNINGSSDLLYQLWQLQNQNQTGSVNANSSANDKTTSVKTGDSSASSAQQTPQQLAQLSYNENLMHILNAGDQNTSSLISSLLQNTIPSTATASSTNGIPGSSNQQTPQQLAQLSYNENLMHILNAGNQSTTSLISTLLKGTIDMYQ